MRRRFLSAMLLVGSLTGARTLAALELTGRVVDKGGGGVSDAVVFVVEARAKPAPRQVAVMDQIHKQFVPHILPVVVGTRVHFPNRDQIHHHVYSFSRTKSFEIPLHKGEDTEPVLFDKEGVVKVGCNIHDWMSGVILVLPTPYYATTDEDGRFKLPDLAPGPYPVTVWHERSEVEPEALRRDVRLDESIAPLTIELEVAAKRSRPAVHGLRGYE
jgi:plastocyanin